MVYFQLEWFDNESSMIYVINKISIYLLCNDDQIFFHLNVSDVHEFWHIFW